MRVNFEKVNVYVQLVVLPFVIILSGGREVMTINSEDTLMLSKRLVAVFMDFLPRLFFMYHKVVVGNQGFSSQMEKMNDRKIVVLESISKLVDFAV